MNPEWKAKWVAWLRDPASRQGRDRLTTIIDDIEYDCCMGGLCKITETPASLISSYDASGAVVSSKCYAGARVTLPDVTQNKVGLRTDNPSFPVQDRNGWGEISCITANDTLRLTFPQIADLVEYFL